MSILLLRGTTKGFEKKRCIGYLVYLLLQRREYIDCTPSFAGCVQGEKLECAIM